MLFTGGVDEPAYVEHSSLALLLGFHLVEAPTSSCGSGRVWLRTLGGLEPIDVVYRRLEDAASTRSRSARRTARRRRAGLLLAAAEGGVVLANAHGAGVLEDPALCAVLAGVERVA